jgi:hypothetical protein
MKRVAAAIAIVCSLAACCQAADPPEAKDGWISLFDGKTLDGWKVGKNAGSFRIEDGQIVANGPVAHLFYVGDVCQHEFKNFELKAQLMTFPKANSGIYFHTKYQEGGWPKVGYEAQVNNSHSDPKRTGSLYGVRDVLEVPAKDNVWFTEEVIVRGKHIVIKVDGKTVVDYTEAADDIKGERRLSRGTFALQAHDPVSKVCYKSIMVKPLPE